MTTPRPLSDLSESDTAALPVGEEVDALVAVHLLGWQWWREKSRGKCVLHAPADAQDWTRSNFAEPFFDLVDWPGELFGDWARGSMLWRKNGRRDEIVSIGVPQFSTCPVASKMLREEIVKRELRYYISSPDYDNPNFNAHIQPRQYCSYSDRSFWGRGKDEYHALAIAALLMAKAETALAESAKE